MSCGRHFLLTWTLDSKIEFTTFLTTPRPLDRHPSSHNFQELFFILYKEAISILKCPFTMEDELNLEFSLYLNIFIPKSHSRNLVKKYFFQASVFHLTLVGDPSDAKLNK